MIEPLKETLLKLILNEVARDRVGELVNQTVVHGVINSFVNVQEYKRKHPLMLYEELLETPYKLETGAHYRQEAAKLKDEHSCSDYMEKVGCECVMNMYRIAQCKYVLQCLSGISDHPCISND